MKCRQVTGLLVAFSDAELAPGQHVLVSEHIDRCDACAAQLERLDAATPQAALMLPPGLAERNWNKLDAALDREWASRHLLPDGPPPGRWAHINPLAPSTTLAYTLAVAAVFLWAMSYVGAPSSAPLVATPIVQPTVEIREFAPASYLPQEHGSGNDERATRD